jgi:hypothetical protein
MNGRLPRQPQAPCVAPDFVVTTVNEESVNKHASGVSGPRWLARRVLCFPAHNSDI